MPWLSRAELTCPRVDHQRVFTQVGTIDSVMGLPKTLVERLIMECFEKEKEKDIGFIEKFMKGKKTRRTISHGSVWCPESLCQNDW
ncbi:hypothetical protein CsSME_00036096 [Camellia sinensis var. sinensis]